MTVLIYTFVYRAFQKYTTISHWKQVRVKLSLDVINVYRIVVNTDIILCMCLFRCAVRATDTTIRQRETSLRQHKRFGHLYRRRRRVRPVL